MKVWHKGLIGAALVLALPVGATAVFGGTPDSAPKVRSIDVSGHARADGNGVSDTRAGSSDANEDISGPCDEAEHANDPRCAGVTADPSPSPRASVDDDDDRDDDGPGDISGPCDEAEHANDPRCTGATGSDDDSDDSSNSGPGS
ncbi:MAG: hypothetical protein QOG04_1925, partial [Actinomycetota bacterium]|nr:hypothetical protein [Actinomycetota bacterium]